MNDLSPDERPIEATETGDPFLLGTGGFLAGIVGLGLLWLVQVTVVAKFAQIISDLGFEAPAAARVVFFISSVVRHPIGLLVLLTVMSGAVAVFFAIRVRAVRWTVAAVIWFIAFCGVLLTVFSLFMSLTVILKEVQQSAGQ